jgi:hypothetical protein
VFLKTFRSPRDRYTDEQLLHVCPPPTGLKKKKERKKKQRGKRVGKITED